jgi:hypothetical protein
VCWFLTMVQVFVAIPPAEPPACPLPLNASAPQPPGAAPSLMLERGLLCGREHEADLLESAFIASMLYGAGIVGNVANCCGRRPTLMLCALFSFVGACWSAAAVTRARVLCPHLGDPGAGLPRAHTHTHTCIHTYTYIYIQAPGHPRVVSVPAT